MLQVGESRRRPARSSGPPRFVAVPDRTPTPATPTPCVTTARRATRPATQPSRDHGDRRLRRCDCPRPGENGETQRGSAEASYRQSSLMRHQPVLWPEQASPLVQTLTYGHTSTYGDCRPASLICLRPQRSRGYLRPGEYELEASQAGVVPDCICGDLHWSDASIRWMRS